MVQFVARYSKRQEASCHVHNPDLVHVVRQPGKRLYGRKSGTLTHPRIFMCQICRANEFAGADAGLSI